MRRFLKLIPWAIATLVLLLASWYAVTTYYRLQFEAEVDQLRADGIRVDLAQFNGARDESFSATLLREVQQLREEHDLAYCRAAEVLDMGLVPPDEVQQAWNEIAEWIAKNDQFSEAVDQAVRDPGFHFAVDHRDAWNAEDPSISLSQPIVQMYEWRVRLAERLGDPARKSLSDCLTVFEWGRRVNRRFVIAYLVAGTVDQVACGMLKRIATMKDFDPGEAWAVLNPVLVRAEDECAMWDAFESECALMIHAVRTAASWEGTQEIYGLVGGNTDSPLWDRLRMTALRPRVWRNGVASLRCWDRARTILDDGGQSALGDLQALEAEWKREHTDGGKAHDWSLVATGFQALPYLVGKTRQRHSAHLRVARAGLNALNILHVTGRWPDPDTGLIDPFTGKPLMLVPEGDTVRIEAAVPWLDEYGDEELREEERIYWTLSE